MYDACFLAHRLYIAPYQGEDRVFYHTSLHSDTKRVQSGTSTVMRCSGFSSKIENHIDNNRLADLNLGCHVPKSWIRVQCLTLKASKNVFDVCVELGFDCTSRNIALE